VLHRQNRWLQGSPCLSAWSQETLKAFVRCTCRVVISRMYIMDNILFSTKKEIINYFPIESTHPPRSTHGGIFELPNTLRAYIAFSRRCGDAALTFCPLSYLREECISCKNDRIWLSSWHEFATSLLIQLIKY
jgi:hypothetical protein